MSDVVVATVPTMTDGHPAIRHFRQGERLLSVLVFERTPATLERNGEQRHSRGELQRPIDMDGTSVRE